MIWQMDLLLILSKRERMADGEEVKREHLEGDREEGCAKGLGVRRYRRIVQGTHAILLKFVSEK